MKKKALTICTALSAAAASADTLLGFDASAGSWQPAYSGSIGVDDFDAENFSLAEDNVTFLQLALEHPIPLIPNVMVSHSRIKTRGSSLLDSNVNFDDETFYAGQDVAANMKLSHTDATLYYEILDNRINLDLGLTARQYRGFFHAVGKSQTSDPEAPDPASTESLKLHGVLPMIYGKARFDLPFTGWSIIAQGNATSYKGDNHTDLTAKVRWDIAPVVDFGIEAGYRIMNLDVDELDDLQTDLEIKGPYLGLNMHL